VREICAIYDAPGPESSFHFILPISDDDAGEENKLNLIKRVLEDFSQGVLWGMPRVPLCYRG
jgi:hypothetical protein